MQRVVITALSLTLLIAIWFMHNWSPVAKLVVGFGWFIVVSLYLLIRKGRAR